MLIKKLLLSQTVPILMRIMAAVSDGNFRQKHNPVVVICGATGTGKSKLAIDLAKLFHGEIINADAMQLYEGLSISTNKVTASEAAGIPHHLLGSISTEYAGRFDVHDYRERCLPLIHRIREQEGHLPILVGGTHYYIEAVLWSDFLEERAPGSSEQLASFQLPAGSTDCYNKLRLLDPDVAAALHPNNARKVRIALVRALSRQVANESPTGRSTHTSRSHPSSSPNRPTHPRYPGQTIIFWLDCRSDILHNQLDKRVDKMLKAGLINELDDFLRHYFNKGSCLNCSEERSEHLDRLFDETKESVQDPFTRRGVLQTIGFKEFSDYLALPPSSGKRDSAEGKQLLADAIKQVKTATRQYARRQIKWIVNRFLTRPSDGSLPVYRLDVTEYLAPDGSSFPQESWLSKIVKPAACLIHDHIRTHAAVEVPMSEELKSLLNRNGAEDDSVPLLSPCEIVLPKLSSADPTELSGPHVCSYCNGRKFVRQEDWLAHTKSRGHQKRVNKVRRRELLQSVSVSED
ncbi:unnamed protein product [Calicophoron daubneyi]|uniref:tRNA dimethylallyltransferase n=1 Tax=Calicophoron daubneyi TaxID=300641 RepID=A0AAV2T219_CALDB